MIELTTGAVFLTLSLYAGAPAGHEIKDLVTVPVAEAQVAAIESSSLTKDEQTTERTISRNADEQSAAIEAYLRKAYAGEPVLVEIARCESNFRQYGPDGRALRGRVNSRDIGVMQINEKYQGPQAKELGLDIYSVAGNAAYAKILYEKEGTAPWISSSKCWAGDIAKR